MKQRLLQGLGRAPVSPTQRVRIVLHNVDVGARMEFPEVCRLAHRVRCAEIRDPLVQRLHGDDVATAVRALRILLATRRPRLSYGDLDRAREVLVDWAGAKQELSGCRWFERAVRRLWNPTWAISLAEMAEEESDVRQLGAKRVLRLAPRRADGGSRAPTSSAP